MSKTAPVPTYTVPEYDVLPKRPYNTLGQVNYWQWRGKNGPNDMCWNGDNYLGKCEQMGGEYTTVGSTSCYNSSHGIIWERNNGRSPICGSGSNKYTANRDYCCTHWGDSGDGTRTCDPNWTAGSPQCSAPLENQCQPEFDQGGFLSKITGAIGKHWAGHNNADFPYGLRNLFADQQCQQWCQSNTESCEAKKRAYCNTAQGILDPNCQQWCKTPGNEGKCNEGAAIMCNTYPDDPFCACISASVPSNGSLTGSAALQCFDAKCLSTGYKTGPPGNCSIVSCDQIAKIAAGGNINASGTSINQTCNITASNNGSTVKLESNDKGTTGGGTTGDTTGGTTIGTTIGTSGDTTIGTSGDTTVNSSTANTNSRTYIIIFLLLLVLALTLVAILQYAEVIDVVGWFD